MKNSISLTLALCILGSIALNAQKTNFPEYTKGPNELRLNVLGLVLPGQLDLSYERLLDASQSVGIQVAYFIPTEDIDNYMYDISTSAHYRLYISSDRFAAGFFIQGGLNFSSATVENYDFVYDPVTGGVGEISEEQAFFFGPEVGLGGKWVLRKGLVVELGATIGRNLLAGSDLEFMGNYWLSIGKRF